MELGIREYYHVYNRGVLKTKIFLEESDWARFLFYILYFQSDIVFGQSGRHVASFVRHRVFDIKPKLETEITRTRNVALVAFASMPNHFHLLIQNVKEVGISHYMQRVLNAYAKYFNVKYQRNGHLFQGPYRSVHIEDNDQLLHLSAYIHKHRSPWSSAKDYFGENRWGDLLTSDIILDQFANKTEYQKWVKENPAKEPEYL